MKSSALLNAAVANGGLRELDRWFADHMAALFPDTDPAVVLAAALVSQQLGEGHVCVELSQWAGQALFATENWPGLSAPSLDDWYAALQGSALVGEAGANTPLLVDAGRVYLSRYWHYERDLADALLARARAELFTTQTEALKVLSTTLFGAAEDTLNEQALAAAVAMVRPLTIISGGPGTGKTHTVAAILALLCKDSRPRIALAAPTGKAAVRLTESIHKARARLAQHSGMADIVERIPEQAMTLHRLLGVRPGRVTPDYSAENPLRIDVLVVDEASMISLPMMAKMLSALPAEARLILLGDKDQLASVEAGSVFADLCAGGDSPDYSPPLQDYLAEVTGKPERPPCNRASGPMADSLVLLHKSYRFAARSGIGGLATAINQGNGAAAAGILESAVGDPAVDDLDWQNPPEDKLQKALAHRVTGGFAPLMAAQTPQEALLALNRFRILCALRVGPTGVATINAQTEQTLRDQGLIASSYGVGYGGGDSAAAFYQGRPVMVTENVPAMNLFNGDIGVVWPDPDSGALRVWFPDPENHIRSVSPGRLPRHETAYAMTVHKSQGSEFDTVLLLLPWLDNPVLSRELVYTGVTRAVQRCELWSAPHILQQACERQVSRASGLRDKLYPPAIS